MPRDSTGKVIPARGRGGGAELSSARRNWGKLSEVVHGDHKLVWAGNNGAKKRRRSSGQGSSSGSNRADRITDKIDEIRKAQIQRLNINQRAGPQSLAPAGFGRPGTTLDLHAATLGPWDRLLFRLKTFTVHPKRVWKQVWDIVILLFVVFSSIQIPMLLAFPDMEPLADWVQIALDVIFILDFGLCFRTGFVRADNEIELDQSEIMRNYLKTWFPIDLAACFPLDYFFSEEETGDSSDSASRAALRLLKLPRLLRLGRLLKFLARFKYAGAVKILKFVFALVLVAHWVGCAFFFIMGLEHAQGRGTWMEHSVGLVQKGENIPGRYLNMLYASFLMLIGEGMDMETDVEVRVHAL